MLLEVFENFCGVHMDSFPWLRRVSSPQQDAEGLREEIKNGIALAHFTLPLGPDEALRELSMYTGSDSGDGIFQTSFRGRLELTKVLLERAGFQVAAR